jgi:polyisoprenoid-binding protein YceI
MKIMKKQVLNMFTVVALCIAVVGCKKAKEANTSEAEAAAVTESTSQKYIVNVEESTIEWKGFKPTGTHNGTIKIENGVFSTNDGKMHAGTFLINMSSIEDAERNERLEGHLKSADFFDVEKFPNAAFEVTGIEGNMLSGNLAIKGMKNNISFPVTITEENDVMSLTSEAFTIDRSKWNVQYGSKKFFDNLGDKFINDDIELKISLKAKKA